jgi:hypothetical protein
MKSIESDDHRVFSRIIDFSRKMSSRTIRGHDVPEQVISSEFPKLVNSLSLPDFVRMVADCVKSESMPNLSKVIAVVRAMVLTKVGSNAEASSMLLDSQLNMRGVTLEACVEAMAVMEFLGLDKENKDDMTRLIRTRFPFAKDMFSLKEEMKTNL